MNIGGGKRSLMILMVASSYSTSKMFLVILISCSQVRAAAPIFRLSWRNWSVCPRRAAPIFRLSWLSSLWFRPVRWIV